MNQSGITLLEALVALAILAGLAAVAVPYLRETPRATVLELAAKQAAAELRRAQGRAIRTNRPAEVVIDVTTGEIGRERIRSSGAPIGLALLTTADQRRDAARGTIRFFPNGGATGGGLTLTHRGLRVDVVVDWLTGRVSVEHGPGAAVR